MERPEGSIVITAPNQTSYVDDAYFRSVMGEVGNNENSLTFTVDLKAIRADWIINEQAG